MTRSTEQEQTTIRLHATILNRADALVEKLRKRNPTRLPTFKRSDVLRMALEAGLSQLEQDEGGAQRSLNP